MHREQNQLPLNRRLPTSGNADGSNQDVTSVARTPNSRVHLPGGSVTALARKPMKMNHHLVPPGPRRTSPAGDANVRHGLTRPCGSSPLEGL